VNDRRQIVLVTGAGSGLGMESALLLASRGYQVYGSVLNSSEREAAEKEAARHNVHIAFLQMDVTKETEVREAVRSMVAEAGTIDAVVQFAGMGLRGFFEDLALDEIRRVFDVNVFGMMIVTQAVLPYMRRAGAGRIILTTSIGGRMGSMSIGGYASSKFAAEGFGECLRQELYPLGIFVSLLEPGLVHTPHFTVNRNRARKAEMPDSPYYAWFCQHEHIVDGILAKGRIQGRDVAETVDRILRSRNPALRYVVGTGAKWILRLRRYTPGELFERIYWGAVRKMVTRPKKPISVLSGQKENTGKSASLSD
jgi:NAD(P)-dependent dehydrogenase (short-subunit alcohol dehydrogenase family)